MENVTTTEGVQPPEQFIDLKIGDIISQSFKIGFGNFWKILIAFILWLITIWIPYLNIGTTIAMTAAIVVALSKNEPFAIGDIFKSKYRKNFGEFLLLSVFIGLGIYCSVIFLIFPAIVLSLSWGLAYYIWFEKETCPAESLKESNKITYGCKWRIFWAYLVLSVIFGVVLGIAYLIFNAIDNSGVLPVIISIIIMLIFIPISYGAEIYIYKMLRMKL